MNVTLYKSKRILKGLIQKDVARYIGITEKTYNHKERGLISFTIEEILAASEILELSLSDVNDIFFDSNLPVV